MSKGVRAHLITTEMRVTQFWLNVDRRGPDECWPWTGYVEDEYGYFFDGERMVGAHELALTWTTGERRLAGLDTCHSCNRPICVNPAHLRFDTRLSNVADAIAAGTHGKKLTQAQVVEMRERAALGATGDTLAEAYGVSRMAVSFILTGRRWKKAGGPIREPHPCGPVKRGTQ